MNRGMQDQKRLRRTLARAGKWAGSRLSVVLNGTLGSRSHGRFGILMYHRVTETGPGGRVPTWNVSPGRFARQMDDLLARGYQFRSLPEIVASARNGDPIPPKVTAVTFDDGYANAYRNAYPILKVRNIPATIFVASAFIGTAEPFPFDDWARDEDPPDAWMPLTWAECGEMQRSGVIDIGTHSHTHQDFRGRPGDLNRDLCISLQLINRTLGHVARTFSFPYGNTRLGFADSRMAEAARNAGVICALNSEIGLNEPGCSPFHWKRIEAVEDDTGATLAAKLEGWYSWMDSVRAAFCLVSPPELAGAGDRRFSQ